ncbi:MAG: phosphoribosylformylglycinamidine synthase subunit PurS [Alphaproteobacteria bacterium]|nr:phosphoribosylformylglycinamidine synthase subunit PurS [Alphaproteobacteria bacterium]
MKARVHITLKPGVHDPQSKAIASALKGLGFGGFDDVRQGKYIEIDLADSDRASAERIVKEMCAKFLANPVIENYRVDIDAT